MDYTAFTRQGPLVRSQYRPPRKTKTYSSTTEVSEKRMERRMELFVGRQPQSSAAMIRRLRLATDRTGLAEPASLRAKESNCSQRSAAAIPRPSGVYVVPKGPRGEKRPADVIGAAAQIP